MEKMMKRKLLFFIIVFGVLPIKADLFGDRAAFPTYTRVLKNPMPRLVVVQPVPQPSILPQEQQPQENLAHRQLLEQQVRRMGDEGKVVPSQEHAAMQPSLSRLTDEQLNILYKQALEKKREAEITGYTHMYGASEYGYSDKYPR
jgi:hypothetical protein